MIRVRTDDQITNIASSAVHPLKQDTVMDQTVQTKTETSSIQSANARDTQKQVAILRDKLLSAVSEIIGHSTILTEVSSDFSGDHSAATELLEDLTKNIQTSKETYAYIRDELGSGISQSANFLDAYRRQQHRILNLINRLQGVTFLMLHKNMTPQFPQLKPALEAIEKRCQECELLIRRFGELQQDSDYDFEIEDSDDDIQFLLPERAGRILVVDDDSNNRNLLESVLGKYGLQAQLLADGRAAMESLRRSVSEREYFDVVLLDLLMSDVTGFEVLEFMKSQPELSGIPVIIVSGLNQPKLIAQCIKAGADEFLTKPVDNYLLMSRINACLEKQKLKEAEFARFFPAELARDFARNPTLQDVAADADVSILFADIRGFSAICERLQPAESMKWIGDVLGCLSNCIQLHGGVVLDYIGDEIIGMWGAPYEDPQHAEKACDAAVAMLQALPLEVDPKWKELIPEGTRVGIGINSGLARVGNTGSEHRFKYGANGNTVNLASRLQGATKYLQSPFVISQQTRDRLGPTYTTRRLCSVEVVNVQEPVGLYELVSDSQHSISAVRKYENALSLFENQQLSEATAELADLLSVNPVDGPALLLMSKIVEVLINKNVAFNPVIKLPGK